MPRLSLWIYSFTFLYSVVWIILAILGDENIGHPAVGLLIPLGWLAGLGTQVYIKKYRASLNGRLAIFLGDVHKYQIFDDHIPTYRFVDWLLALQRYSEKAKQAERIEATFITEHGYVSAGLLEILKSASLSPPEPPKQQKICIGYEKESFYPEEVFYTLRGPEALSEDDRIVIRILYPQQQGCTIEMACTDADKAQTVLKHLENDALAKSVFRGQFLEIQYRHSPHPDYEWSYPAAEMEIKFHPRPNVTKKDIILDDRVHEILRRNVFDFSSNRDCLYVLGLPRKRALLFYGPPGTGKTFTCRYIHTALENVTTILAAGQSLTRLEDIGKLARQLHPSLVIIEDVDLVFTQREQNPYGTMLGELMDQLDGFTPDEEVMFLLTTNAIERVEEAIRDRPGRINQCLFFGMPVADLRHRYLKRYLEPYPTENVDLDHLVKQTENVSQAFLKEYVLRAVQVAAEAMHFETGKPLPLETSHFDVAFDEMTSHGDPHSHRIMGFQSDGH